MENHGPLNPWLARIFLGSIPASARHAPALRAAAYARGMAVLFLGLAAGQTRVAKSVAFTHVPAFGQAADFSLSGRVYGVTPATGHLGDLLQFATTGHRGAEFAPPRNNPAAKKLARGMQ